MRKWLSVAVLGLAAGATSAANPDEFLVYNFDRYANGMETNSNDLPGRLFVPSDYDPSKSYPLVTFLHGVGERGSADEAGDGVWNTAQVNGNINNLLAAAKARDFILYAPQTWGGWGRDQLDNVANQVARISGEYSVDRTRTYITGISLGGGGTMDLLGNYAPAFAAAVNICGSDNGIPLQPTRLVDTPLWIHHAQNDPTVGVGVSRGRVNAIRGAKGLGALSFPVAGNYVDDGTMRYTEYTSGGHSIWGNVYGQAGVYDWMLAKSGTAPRLELGEKVQFDVGFNQVSEPVNGQTWNSTAYGLWSVTGPVKSYAKTTGGAITAVTLEITDTFANEGVDAANPVNGDGWYVASWNATAAMKLTGLTPGALYAIELFAGRTDVAGTTRFTIDGTSQDLNFANNVANTVLFPNVAAGADGSIALHVGLAPGSTYGYVNWLSVTAVPEPTALAALVPLAAVALRRGRRRTR